MFPCHREKINCDHHCGSKSLIFEKEKTMSRICRNFATGMTMATLQPCTIYHGLSLDKVSVR